MKRQRGRGRKPNGQSNRPLESNLGGQKTRGTATQVFERYQQLARDAASSGDIVGAENYLQHAEHYYRIMKAAQQAQRERADADNRDNENNAGSDANGDNAADASSDAADASSSGPLEVVNPEASDIAASDDNAREEEAPPRRQRRTRRSRASASDGDDAKLDPAASA